MGMVEVKRGDIILVNFNLSKGSEQGGTRPALIIQNDIYNKYSPTTIVAPITSRVYEKEYPTNVMISRRESRLDKDSTILLNQVRTIDKARIIKHIGSVNKEILEKVELAIKASLGLD
ncbi:MAG TPA: type II toxin-antitoxin system PemK/MazF family toxin [Nanoarchaeota archaeon]|nr:type II toxin-antitoxin system PemK/MazF family toxin [Candidatus Pacearchaeota archaeon]HIH18303.1 type II toxin-antitoxin system PemK/MazF family toxin [Nanoarchaeota archaeon]HIH34173.1 type II toxin-antitoxin system PemK/MazF family toxin [Nanoarchaeota archaeon]HIH51251.1 type II toxin-antitoxin system PemK/MazF family toxin [Nanoarchaeota archaeon]HIH65780.1 type II toxin-antitoxin system PemK/MazF family toxin [Nanoarchaeota archaeon]